MTRSIPNVLPEACLQFEPDLSFLANITTRRTSTFILNRVSRCDVNLDFTTFTLTVVGHRYFAGHQVDWLLGSRMRVVKSEEIQPIIQ